MNNPVFRFSCRWRVIKRTSVYTENSAKLVSLNEKEIGECSLDKLEIGVYNIITIPAEEK